MVGRGGDNIYVNVSEGGLVFAVLGAFRRGCDGEERNGCRLVATDRDVLYK
jgi:hypothetical protein